MKKVTNQMIFDHIESLTLTRKARRFIDGCDAQAIIDLFDMNTTVEDIESVADELNEEDEEQSIEEELIEKAKYFNMNPICEKAGVSYNSYRSWKSKGTSLSKDKIEKLLKVMKEVAE